MRLPLPKALPGFFLTCVLGALAWSTGILHSVDRVVYDTQMRWLHDHAPIALRQDVVVIGLDEAAYEEIAEPLLLWHRHWGNLFSDLAQANPVAVGLAIPLPTRSYDFLVKGVEASLLEGMRQLQSRSPVIVGLPLMQDGRLRPLSPDLTSTLGQKSLSALIACEEVDGVVRRLDATHCIKSTHQIPLFATAMAQALGRASAPDHGLIDFSAGAPIRHLPLAEVLNWVRNRDIVQLQKAFQGRIVIVANLLPTESHHRLPVTLGANSPHDRYEPTAMVHIQALRSMLGRGSIAPAPALVTAAAVLLAAMLWFGRTGWRKWLALFSALSVLLLGGTWLLWRGYSLHTGAMLAFGVLSFVLRLMWEAWRNADEKQLLRSAFSGHVSPQVMRAILRGQLHPDGEGQRCKVTVLFADIRNFTKRSEQADPGATLALLNRFYAESTAAIHGKGGAVDKFIGDGLMATFGLPQALPAPERNALEAAQTMLLRMARVNAELTARGEQPLEIGIGIHTGEVLAGYIGTRKRRDFTVIGDTVNTASRLEGLTKTTGYSVVCSNEVAAVVGFGGGLVDLGLQPIKGRSAVHVWGWTPSLHKHIGASGAPEAT